MESPYKLPVSQVSDHVPTRLQPGNITDAPSFSLAEEVPTPWARQDDGLSSTYRHDCGELSIPDFVKVASQEERPQVAQLRASSQKRSLGDKLSDFFKDIAFAFKRLFS